MPSQIGTFGALREAGEPVNYLSAAGLVTRGGIR